MRSTILLLGLLCLSTAQADCWKPVPGPKSLTFVGDQAGAPFPGEFKSYTAAFCLDPKDASKDRLQVQVDLKSVDTGLPEMDAALQNDDFFDVAHWPQAKFVSDSVKQTGAGQYLVTGKLTIRDVTKIVSVPFSWAPAADGKHAKLSAKYALQRLDYGVGKGQWADPQWVGPTVQVAFAIDFVPGQ